ncbi:MAG: FliM/FliN family flagellar motor switch protein [SAR324 cluster bacterium]|nr:FliM/FliN family flagellar motor switch protein [SAR324 cluster bacterium]
MSHKIEEVEAYSLITSHIKTGRFQWLDVVMQRWAALLETTLFDALGVLVEVTTEPVEWKPFGEFFQGLKVQQPIYIFDTDYHGTGLMLVNNKFAHACLADHPNRLLRDFPTTLPELTPTTQTILQERLMRVLQDFEKSWSGISDITIKLKKVTTHPFRAKVMRPFEKCVIARQMLRTHGFTADVVLCFPYYSLDQILQKLDNRKVLPPETLDHYYSEIEEHFSNLMLELEYDVKAELGSVVWGPQHKKVSIEVGDILPIQSKVGNELTLRINGMPMMTGVLGETEDHYAVQITGDYEEKKAAYRKRTRVFKSFTLPSVK